eukprot:8166128-Pyramimonas_sp.AAC.1
MDQLEPPVEPRPATGTWRHSPSRPAEGHGQDCRPGLRRSGSSGAKRGCGKLSSRQQPPASPNVQRGGCSSGW